MHRRVQVEVEWFIALSDAGFAEFTPLSEAARGLLRGLVVRFSEADAQAIKDIEKTTNHDVKAVEYWLKARFEGQRRVAGGGRVRALRLHQRGHQQHQPRADAQERARQVLLPALDRLLARLHAHGARARRRADAQPHPRPDRQPDDGGQGGRQRGGAPGARRARASPPCRCWPR